jgi:hypothetical protein
MLVMSSSHQAIQEAKSVLFRTFTMKDLGPVDTFLGVRITRDRRRRRMWLSQSKYVEEMLGEMGMSHCRPVATPELTSSASSSPIPPPPRNPETGDDDSPHATVQYRTVVGKLNYAAGWTRPDIRSAVRELSVHQAAPTAEAWVKAKRVLRYLKGSMDLGILLDPTSRTPSGSTLQLVGYCDASFASDVNTRRSVTGYTFLLSGCCVTWFAGRQASVSLSTTEAEYVALSDGCKEAVWLRRLLSEIGQPQLKPTPLMEDNQACIAIAENPRDHSRTKHIDLKFHHIRERIADGEVSVEYVPTADQIADIFTKGLPKPAFTFLRDALGIRSSGGVLEGELPVPSHEGGS